MFWADGVLAVAQAFSGAAAPGEIGPSAWRGAQGRRGAVGERALDRVRPGSRRGFAPPGMDSVRSAIPASAAALDGMAWSRREGYWGNRISAISLRPAMAFSLQGSIFKTS